MEWIQENWTLILAVWGGIVTLATAITKLTPTKKDDAILTKVLSVVELFSTAKSKPKE